MRIQVSDSFLISQGLNPGLIEAEYLKSIGCSPDFPHRFFAKVNIGHCCWHWMAAISNTGYGCIWTGGSMGQISAHVGSWILHFGVIPKGQCVLHNCPGGDHRWCVNPQHLWLGTREENNADRDRKLGTWAADKSPVAKLSSDQVIRLRKLHAEGTLNQRQAAKELNVCPATICLAVHGINWSTVH